MNRAASVGLLLCCPALVGCLPPQADEAIKVITEAVPVVERALLDSYRLQLELCNEVSDADHAREAECLEKVKASWKPVIDVMEQVRDVWCTIAPEAEGC